MPTRSEFRRVSSTEQATGNLKREMEEDSSIQSQNLETSSSPTSPTGTQWKDLINYLFDQVNLPRLEERALERLEWGDGPNVVYAVVEQLKEDFLDLEPEAL